jgi:lipopolysaccharide/colanic/teichoic acid biosynthesis glycosyltransferase
MKRKIAYIKIRPSDKDYNFKSLKDKFDIVSFENEKLFLKWGESGETADVIIIVGDLRRPKEVALIQYLKSNLTFNAPLILFASQIDKDTRKKALQLGIAELLELNDEEHKIALRINFLIDFSQNKSKDIEVLERKFKVPFEKRFFDIVFSASLILVLSPLILLIILLIKLESRGPIFYISKRAGAQYKIFNFYKFRSMRIDADRNIKSLKHLNQYKKTPADINPDPVLEKCEECIENNVTCSSQLYWDNKMICEKLYLLNKKLNEEGTFIKFNNDPRVTRVGKFIRNKSIDELPQLFNVLKGDMSIVGNRPLPLYEAEKITTDKYSQRFFAPAGITGLWQVNKRGKGKMSEEERIELDNEYAKDFSFMKDIKIILKTIPALLQKENV